MKLRSLILGAVAALALAAPGFAQNTTTTPQETPTQIGKPFDKITIYVATYVNDPNEVVKNFLNPLVDKLTAQGADLKEGPADVDAANGFELRVFLYSDVDGTASLTVSVLAHTKGNVYPEYLGSGTAHLTKDDEAQIVVEFVVNVADMFTNYLADKKTTTVQ